jgi:LysM repeat protein
MSFKTFTQIIVLLAILVTTFANPGSAQAWSSCGSTYVVQWGDTLGGIAARCGTTVAALYALNPGISGYLYAGQVLVMPAGDYCNCPQDGYANTYTVQRGDIFSEIAKRFGVSTNSLWAANPYIWDINRIYPGQVLNVPAYAPAYVPVYVPVYEPASSWFQVGSGSTEPLVQRSYGTVPPKTPTGNVKLINSANAQVYVSLQGTTNDDIKVINEYPVSGSMSVDVPAGWYIYVAWVGGQKFSGQFKLGGDSSHTLIFYINKVVVE